MMHRTGRTYPGATAASGTPLGSRLPRHLLLAAVLLVAAACTNSTDQRVADETSDPGAGSETTAGITVATPEAETVIAGTDDLAVLPVREGPREETTHGVPHVQVTADLVAEVDAELRRRAFSLPGVENRESELSLPGARSLWLADDVEVARPEVLQAGREFAHIHPNGSLHVWLPVERAIEVTEAKWGELHPWVGRDDFWDGLVMVYTPETLDELDVTMRLIVDAYNYVTQDDLDPGAFP